mmetsp:Transcript_57464/g.91070  ORF Transcript_57464/g.91070 Transcript_57464/m.91070 type:complete len:218 (+) Transcript_57464:1111-1764(+)
MVLDDLTNLWLKTHIQHAVGFVERQEFHLFHAHYATLQEILKSARSTHHDLDASGELSQLWNGIRSTIDGTDTGTRAEGQPFSFDGNLLAELTCGRQHDAGGTHCTLLRRLASSFQRCGDDRDQKCRCLAASRLGSDKHVTSIQDCRNAVLLHRSWNVVVATIDVGSELIRQRKAVTSLLKRLNRSLLSRSSMRLHLNVVIFLEVNTSGNMRLLEQP